MRTGWVKMCPAPGKPASAASLPTCQMRGNPNRGQARSTR